MLSGFKHQLTVFWTTLLSDDNIPIALPTADDSSTALSGSVLAPSTGEDTNEIKIIVQGLHERKKKILKMGQFN